MRRDELQDILRHRREATRTLRVFVVVLEEFAVLFHRRAAARRVHDHRLDISREERIDVPPSQLPRHPPVARMHIERAATRLAFREHDAIAQTVEHSHRRGMGARIQMRHHATREHRHRLRQPLRLRRRHEPRRRHFRQRPLRLAKIL